MRIEVLKELKDLVGEICSYERSFYSSGIREARRIVRGFLKNNRIPFKEEGFKVSKSVPSKSYIYCGDKRIECISYGGSPSAEIEAVTISRENPDEDVEGKIVITEEGGTPTWKKAEIFAEKGAVGLITYIKGVDSFFVGNVRNSPIPVVNIKRSDVEHISGKEIKLVSRTSVKSAECRNIYFEVGKGPLIYMISHLDTKPFTEGAIDNGVSVALLLFIARELLRSEADTFCRIRFLITDCEEFGLEGSSYHVRNSLEHAYYAINLDSVGWHNASVIYKDSDGYNDEEIMDKFYRHISDLKIDIPFRESKTGVSDHIPFKRKGIKSLFLSSNPFSLRHTEMDNFGIIAWDKVEMWHDLLVSFIRRFDRL